MSIITVDTIESKELVLKQINAFKEDRKLIDVVLVAGRDNEKVPAHRLLLASRSEFFRDMFTSAMPEYKKFEIRINDVNGNELMNIVKYCYSGAISLSYENAERVLAAAFLFKLKDLMTACCEFLENRMSTMNCLGIWTMAEKFNRTNLLEKAKAYACDHFMDVCKIDEFLTLDNRRLGELLASDELSVTSEDEIFLSLIRWLQYEQREREQYIRALLSLVRVPFLSPTIVVEQNDFIVDSSGFQAFTKEILKWHLTPTENRPVIEIRQRKSIGTLLAVKWGTLNGTIPIQKYCEKNDKWTTWFTVKPGQKRDFFGVAIMDNELIIAGGRLDNDYSKTVNTVISINTKTKTTKTLDSMGTCRQYVTLVALDDYVYAIGGRDNSWKWLNSVERWSRRTRTWSSVARMNEEKEGQNAAVLNGHIYVIGKSSVVECYNPNTNAWTTKASMNEERFRPGVAVLNGCLYAIGGYETKTVERYDCKANTWTMVSSLNSPRYGFGCIALKDRIIVAGGWNDGKPLSTVEEYTAATNVWKQKLELSDNGYCTIVRARDIS